MAIQDSSTKFDGITYLVNTWYQLFEVTSTQQNPVVINQGVNNDLTTGTVYLSIRTDALTETGNVTDAGIIPLSPGDSIKIEYDSKLWVQVDTLNTCVNIKYFQWVP